MPENAWYLVSAHGAILFYIAVHPDCTIKEISDGMSLTNRTVWGTIGDLREANLIHVRKAGRRHHYTVNLDGLFRHPTILKDTPLRVVLGELVRQFSRSEQSQTR